MTLARVMKLYKLPDQPQLSGLRPMEAKDMPAVMKLVSGYLEKFQLHQRFTQDELAYWMLPRSDVMYSYVREDSDGKVTDVCSFYALAASVLNNDKVKSLKVAYSYWN